MLDLVSAVKRHAEKRRAYANLMQLDDHLLRDIGINRSDLHQMLNGSRTAHTKGIRAHE
jgi:uncharacterized protein YjiS (DUF1127 family)